MLTHGEALALLGRKPRTQDNRPLTPPHVSTICVCRDDADEARLCEELAKFAAMDPNPLPSVPGTERHGGKCAADAIRLDAARADRLGEN